MRAHPNTRHTRAAPQTWALIRGAYLSGLSAPTVAARFGVTVHALRKRARREGWTKTVWAEVQARNGAGPVAAAAPGGGAPDRGAPGDPELDAAVAATAGPLEFRAEAVARRALANAAQAVRLGDGAQALALARAAELIARLDERLPYAGEEPDDEAAFEARQALFRRYLAEQALSLARALAAGEPLPAPYADLQGAWEAREQ